MNQSSILHRGPDHAVIAIPSKGRLKEHVLSFLESKGYVVHSHEGRQLYSYVEGKNHYQVVFLHPKDIATMLHEGIVDIGFTGLDLIAESKVDIKPVVRLNLSKIKMCIMVPKNSPFNHPYHLLDKLIATPFPTIAQQYFDRLKLRTVIRPILGASEGVPLLGIVDAIVDVVESGNSAADNNLKIIADDVFESECVCAVNKAEFKSNHRLINEFLRGIY